MPGRRFHFLLATLLAATIALPLAAQQNSGQQTAPQQQNQDKKKSDKKEPPAQQNPFPEEQSEKAAQQQQNPPSAPAPNAPAPNAPAPQPKRGTSAADQNPFPEAESEKAAKEAQHGQNHEPGNQDSSSSAVPGLKLPGKAGKQAAPGPNPALGAKDTKVGDFYLQSGDWKGAYDRFLEATQVDPGDAEAVYGLADSARHLGNRKLAIQNFQLYLNALPNGPRAKDCRKALKELGARP